MRRKICHSSMVLDEPESGVVNKRLPSMRICITWIAR